VSEDGLESIIGLIMGSMVKMGLESGLMDVFRTFW
jgi:hypothetical protein